MTTKTVNVNGKRRARHFSGPSVTLPRLSPGEGLRSVGEEILPLKRAAVGLGVAAALCGLPAVSTGDTEASNHEAGGGPSGDDADAAPDSVDEHGPRLSMFFSYGRKSCFLPVFCSLNLRNYTSGFARLRFWQFCLHWQAFCLVIDGSSAAKVLARFEYRLC